MTQAMKMDRRQLKKEEEKKKGTSRKTKRSSGRQRRTDGDPKYFCKTWDLDLGRWNTNLKLCSISWYDRTG